MPSSKIQKRDYFFGAALSMFFNHNTDSKPSLIESCGEEACVYRMTTDNSDDFYIYMKYASNELDEPENENERVWQINFSEKDKNVIRECINSGYATFLLLILGSKKLYDNKAKDNASFGEIAVLTKKDYERISHKTGIRIKLVGTRPKVFKIADGKKDFYPIERDRIEKKFTEIKY